MQVWITRYFKSLDQEEITVSVHPETARITGFGHTIPENRPGADLSLEPAREIAARFADSIGWDTTAMDLKESSAEMKKARRDYSLEWEARPGDPRNVDQTRWRVEVNVSGDRVTSARGFWKLPEDWQRGRERENAIAIAISVLRIGTLAGFIVYALWLLIQGTRQGIVRWRPAIRLAIPATILFPVAPLLSAGLMLKNYRTDVPLETFQALTYVTLAMSVIFGFLYLGAASAIIVTYFPDALPSLRRENRATLAVDALAALAAAAGIALIVQKFQAILLQQFHAQAVFSIFSPDIIASAAPALAAVSNAVRALLTDAALLGLLTLLAWQLTKPWMRYAAALLALCATVPSEVRTPGEFLLQYAISLVMAAAGVAFCWFFARRNYLAYALVIWLVALRTPMMQLLGTGNPALQTQGYLIGAIMAATLIWAFAPALLARPPSGPVPVGQRQPAAPPSLVPHFRIGYNRRIDAVEGRDHEDALDPLGPTCAPVCRQRMLRAVRRRCRTRRVRRIHPSGPGAKLRRLPQPRQSQESHQFPQSEYRPGHRVQPRPLAQRRRPAAQSHHAAGRNQTDRRGAPARRRLGR